jgi:hypothetical protein
MPDVIGFRVDTDTLRAEIAKQIVEADQKAETFSLQLLLEGTNVAKQLVLKDTHDLERSIDSASKVERISPCVFNITLANGMDYGSAQETGPITSKKVWRFNPHIRPGYAIMMAKTDEVFDRVYGEG